MGMRLWHHEWQDKLWKFLTNPVTEVVGLVALVLLALFTLVTVEARLIQSPHAPIVYSPK